MGPMTNQDLIDEWTAMLRVQNMSNATINEYEKAVRILLLMPFFADKELVNIDLEDLNEFMYHRSSVDQVAAKTTNKNLAGIKSLLNYCLNKKYISENFYSDVRVKDRSQNLPRPLPIDTLHEVLDNKKPRNPKYQNQWTRDLAAAEVAYSAGLRISELHAIELSKMSLSSGTLRVIGKGRKERICFLGKKAIEAVSLWLVIRSTWIKKAGVNDCGYLFIAPSGRHITVNHLGACITKLLAENGEIKRGSTHTLRHSFASHLYNRTKDIRAVQEMLGHASISTTQVYTLVDTESLTSAYMDAHPRAVKEDVK